MSLRLVQERVFYALLFLLPFSKAAIEVLFPILLVAWLVWLALGGWQTSVWRTLEGQVCLAALVGYLVVCVFAIMTSMYPQLSLQGFVRKTLEYAFLFLIAGDLVCTPRMAVRSVGILCTSAVLVALDGIVQELLGGFEPLRQRDFGGFGRMTGPYENPNDLAIYLLVVLLVLMGQLASRPHRLSRGWWLALLLVAGCFIRTESFSGCFGFAAGAAALWYAAPSVRRAIASIAVPVAVVASMLVIFQGDVWAKLHLTAYSGLQDRQWMWAAASSMIQERPLLGHGLNTFMANYLQYWVGGEQMPRYAHNCFLQVAAETGLLGLGAWLLLLGALLWVWRRSVMGAHDGVARGPLLGIGAALIAFVAQSALDTNFYGLRHAVLFWTLAGAMVGLASRLRQPQEG